jgi:serine/threonine-protein kinase HipA
MPAVETYVFLWRDGAWVPAGLLRIEPHAREGSARFAYGRRYLERPDRLAIDPVSLPLPEPRTEVEFVTQRGLPLFGAIADATPDGWGQYLMYKALDDRLPNIADLVLASGDRRVGAIAFGPTRERPKRIMPWGDDPPPGEFVSLAELAEAAERAQSVESLDEGLRRLLNATSSLGGARPKAATDIAGAPWIAKFPRRQDTFPECRVELATMRLAAACGLDVPELGFECLLDRDIYLIRRFDRRTDDPAQRLPFVSGLTMLAAHESETPRFAYADLAAVVRSFGTRVRRDLHELFDRMTFNVLVTNDDDHLRNHGFLHVDGGWNLSPLYDVVPKPQIGLERRLALGVGDDGRAATLANCLSGARHFDLTNEEAKKRLVRMAGQVAAGWEEQFAAASIGAADRARFATCFRQADPAVHGLAG